MGLLISERSVTTKEMSRAAISLLRFRAFSFLISAAGIQQCEIIEFSLLGIINSYETNNPEWKDSKIKF